MAILCCCALRHDEIGVRVPVSTRFRCQTPVSTQQVWFFVSHWQYSSLQDSIFNGSWASPVKLSHCQVRNNGAEGHHCVARTQTQTKRTRHDVQNNGLCTFSAGVDTQARTKVAFEIPPYIRKVLLAGRLRRVQSRPHKSTSRDCSVQFVSNNLVQSGAERKNP